MRGKEREEEVCVSSKWAWRFHAEFHSLLSNLSFNNLYGTERADQSGRLFGSRYSDPSCFLGEVLTPDVIFRGRNRVWQLSPVSRNRLRDAKTKHLRTQSTKHHTRTFIFLSNPALDNHRSDLLEADSGHSFKYGSEMSHSAETRVPMDEEIPLNTVPGASEDMTNDDRSTPVSFSCQPAASCCKDEHHRKLAISSIICGISCIGIVALISSVKAEQAEQAKDPESADFYSRRARKCGIIAIVVWLVILVFTPIFLVLVSYLVTLTE